MEKRQSVIDRRAKGEKERKGLEERERERERGKYQFQFTTN